MGLRPCLITENDYFIIKTPAKVEISENAGYVLCQRGETGFWVLKRHIMHQEMLNVM